MPASVYALLLPQLTVRTAHLQGPGWALYDAELALKDGAFSLQAERLQLPGQTLRQIQLSCPAIIKSNQTLRCSQAAVQAQLAGLPLKGQLSFYYELGVLQLNSSEWHWGDNRLRFAVEQNNEQWQIDLQPDNFSLTDLGTLLPTIKNLLGQAQAKLNGHIKLQGQNTVVQQAEWNLTPKNIQFSFGEGNYAAEQLSGQFSGQWTPSGQTRFDIKLQQGQLLLQQLFWDLSERSLHLQGQASIRAGQPIELNSVQFRDTGVVQVRASAKLDLNRSPVLQSGEFTISPSNLTALSEHYLKSMLSTSGFADVQLSGQAEAQMAIQQGQLSAIDMTLQDINLSWRGERIQLQGLTGHLAMPSTKTHRLGWARGSFYGISIDGSELVFSAPERQLVLQSLARIPILDGALYLQQLRVEHLLSAQAPIWQFSGYLQPISMSVLSQVLGWPELAGQLGGVIPSARYQNQTLQTDGTLKVDIFDGYVLIDKLQLKSPATLPELLANINIERLDLGLLSSAFDFGRIEGKLSGWVRDLHLQDWQPIKFDARLFSADNDRSRRRISQRAVETISALGQGGATAALSRGFLSLFEDFRYHRLGIGCKLERGICQMVGIGPAPGTDGGYYLVEGSGLPRIDVIAYNRLVDWDGLLARIKAALASQGPIVQ